MLRRRCGTSRTPGSRAIARRVPNARACRSRTAAASRPDRARRARSAWRRSTSARSRRRVPGRRRPRRRDSCPRTRCRASRASCGCRPRSRRDSGPAPRRHLVVVTGAARERGDRGGGERQSDRLGTDGQQTCHVMRLARVVHVGHDRASRPQAGVRERDVDRSHGEHGGDRRPIGPGVDVAHDQDRLTVGGRGHRFGAEPLGARRAGRAAPRPARHVASKRRPDGRSHRKKLSNSSSAAALGSSLRSERPRAEQDGERHHRPLAQMVHRPGSSPARTAVAGG